MGLGRALAELPLAQKRALAVRSSLHRCAIIVFELPRLKPVHSGKRAPFISHVPGTFRHIRNTLRVTRGSSPPSRPASDHPASLPCTQLVRVAIRPALRLTQVALLFGGSAVGRSLVKQVKCAQCEQLKLCTDLEGVQARTLGAPRKPRVAVDSLFADRLLRILRMCVRPPSARPAPRSTSFHRGQPGSVQIAVHARKQACPHRRWTSPCSYPKPYRCRGCLHSGPWNFKPSPLTLEPETCVCPV